LGAGGRHVALESVEVPHGGRVRNRRQEANLSQSALGDVLPALGQPCGQRRCAKLDDPLPFDPAGSGATFSLERTETHTARVSPGPYGLHQSRAYLKR